MNNSILPEKCNKFIDDYFIIIIFFYISFGKIYFRLKNQEIKMTKIYKNIYCKQKK